MELTAKQQQFLDYLTERMDEEGRIPTLRQAAGDLGVSHTAVAQLMTQLEKKGVLARESRYGRTIRLCPDHGERRRSVRAGRELPLIGQVAAGLPMYAQQEWAGTVVVDPGIFPGEGLFCLRIKGESMRDAGILDGDVVVCEPRQYAENGEIVAVLIRGEEATVKRFFLYTDHIELRPANDAFPVMCYPFSDLLVQGKVVGVIRGRHAEFDGKGEQ
jgi:repressor LexA